MVKVNVISGDVFFEKLSLLNSMCFCLVKF